MLKKMGLLVTAAGVLAAFALPATASAVTLKTESGSTLPAGSEIKLSSSNTNMTFGGGVGVICSVLGMDGETWGSGTETSGIALEGGGTGCFFEPFKSPFTLSAIEAEITLEAGGKGSMTFAYLYSAPSIGWNECTMEGFIGASYEASSPALSVSGGPLVGSGGEGCPKGLEKFASTFSLTTSTGEPVYIK